MPLVYRIQKKQFIESVLTGEGDRLNGGRWNPPGISLSLHVNDARASLAGNAGALRWYTRT